MSDTALAVGVAVLGTVGVLAFAVWWDRRVAGRSDSLAGQERDFRTDLMDRVKALETKVQNLEERDLEWQRRDLFWRGRELDWQRIYQILLEQYLRIVEQLGPGANAPPPPPPPPPPEGSGGGLLTGPSPRPRTMPSQDRSALLHLLEGSALGGGTRDRDSLLLGLPDGYKTQVQRAAGVRDDLGNMIQAALDWGGDPPLLSAWLDNVCDALGGDESEKVRAIQAWRKAKRW